MRGLCNALHPLSLRDGNGYINAPADLAQDRERDNYGAAKCDRLAGVKALHGPEKALHHNTKITPPAVSSSLPSSRQTATIPGSRSNSGCLGDQ